MSGTLPFKVEIVGDKEVARALQNISKRLEALERAQSRANSSGRSFSKGMKGSKKSSDEFNRSLAGVVNEMTEFGFAMSATNPALRQYGVNLASAGNSAFQLGVKMGPLGIALGLLVGLIPAVVMALSNMDDELVDNKESADDLAEGIDKIVAKMKKASAAAQQLALIRAGLADPLKQQAESSRLAEKSTRAQKVFFEVLKENTGSLADAEAAQIALANATGKGNEGITDAIELLKQRGIIDASATRDIIKSANNLANIRSQQAAAENTARKSQFDENQELADNAMAETEAANDAHDKRENERKKRQGKASARAAEAAQRQREREMAEFERDFNAVADTEKRILRQQHKLRERELERKEAQRERDKKMQEADDRSTWKRANNLANRISQTEQQAIQERQQMREDAALDTLQIQTDLASGLADAAMSGEQGQLDAFAKNFAKRAALQSLEMGALALASLALQRPDAAIQAGIAASAYAAAAAAAGGVAAVATNKRPTPSATPTRTDTGGTGGGGGGGTTVINFNSPVPDREIGRLNRRAEKAAAKRFGERG